VVAVTKRFESGPIKVRVGAFLDVFGVKERRWSQATVIDREPERFTRWIKEAIYTHPEGRTTGHEH